MAALKSMILHSHRIGSNPWKVAIILEELDLPYKHRFIAFKDMKTDAYEALNPNGRVPTLEDPNTGVTIWEVSALPSLIMVTETFQLLTFSSPGRSSTI
jgi:glutathione S-transferase